MGLLPDEEGARVGWGLACPGVGHLHPAHAFEPLALGYLTGDGIGDGVIPMERLGDRLRTVPKCEIDQMPPSHLEVRASEPGVIRQS